MHAIGLVAGTSQARLAFPAAAADIGCDHRVGEGPGGAAGAAAERYAFCGSSCHTFRCKGCLPCGRHGQDAAQGSLPARHGKEGMGMLLTGPGALSTAGVVRQCMTLCAADAAHCNHTEPVMNGCHRLLSSGRRWRCHPGPLTRLFAADRSPVVIAIPSGRPNGRHWPRGSK